jgi:CRISPR-associated endonuclease Cas1
MATAGKLPQYDHPISQTASITPRHGVITLFGYGIQVRVDRGHLLIEDGIGSVRRQARLPRVGHDLRRLIVIGADGMVSLAALRWLADQDAAFVMLDRDGAVLAATGPVRSSDARLRRAQALADSSGAALLIARELIGQKLVGQETVARGKLRDPKTADNIAQFRYSVASAETIEAICLLESQGASAYWAAWRNLPINFPKADLRRVPDHWRTFSTRKSPLSGSSRLAANPANAILNYAYAVAESEALLAVTSMGMDGGLGFFHADAPARDSLACDVMEPVRPKVDAYVLDWIMGQPLKREWFFEKRDGNCRLMASFAIRLSETAPMWRHAVAPFAEWVARTLWSTSAKPGLRAFPPTRLTQSRKREAKGALPFPPATRVPQRQKLCPSCGKEIRAEVTHCGRCAIEGATQRLVDAARLGRVVARTPEVRAKQAASQRQQAKARSSWAVSSQPAWLTEEVYAERIQPLLTGMSSSSIASKIGVSRWYAGRVRMGHRPHPRHWQALADLVCVTLVGLKVSG